MSPWQAGIANGSWSEAGPGAVGFEAGRYPPSPEPMARLVDVRGVGCSKHGRGVAVEHCQTGRQVLGRNQIVVGGPPEVRSARSSEDEVEVSWTTDISVVPHIPDSIVAYGVLATDRLGTVGGGVVADDQLEIRERLREQRIESFAEVFVAVANGQSDTDTR